MVQYTTIYYSAAIICILRSGSSSPLAPASCASRSANFMMSGRLRASNAI